MPTPLPGRPVRSSRTGRPIMALLDLLGRRWMLRVLWELRTKPLGFRALQEACDRMSSSVLRDRLAELDEAGLVTTDAGAGYALTRHGRQLLDALEPLDAWSKTWAHDIANTRLAPRDGDCSEGGAG